MRSEVEALIGQLSRKYRVRDRFMDEIVPLVEKIYSGKFSEAKRSVLITLAEDAFRREQEIFDQQVESSKALTEMCDDLQAHYQQVVNMQKNLTDAVDHLAKKRSTPAMPTNRIPFGPSLN
jgi:hypothetical protein